MNEELLKKWDELRYQIDACSVMKVRTLRVRSDPHKGDGGMEEDAPKAYLFFCALAQEHLFLLCPATKNPDAEPTDPEYDVPEFYTNIEFAKMKVLKNHSHLKIGFSLSFKSINHQFVFDKRKDLPGCTLGAGPLTIGGPGGSLLPNSLKPNNLNSGAQDVASVLRAAQSNLENNCNAASGYIGTL